MVSGSFDDARSDSLLGRKPFPGVAAESGTTMAALGEFQPIDLLNLCFHDHQMVLS